MNDDNTAGTPNYTGDPLPNDDFPGAGQFPPYQPYPPQPWPGPLSPFYPPVQPWPDSNKVTVTIDKQEGGNHYEGLSPQPIEVSEAWFPREQLIGAYRANVLKYLARWGSKDSEGNPLEDAKKAMQYLGWLVAVLEKDEE